MANNRVSIKNNHIPVESARNRSRESNQRQRKADRRTRRQRLSTAKNEPRFTQDDRKAMFARQNGKCFYCGLQLAETHIDHGRAKHEGGRNVLSNAVLVHPNCHETKNSIERRNKRIPRQAVRLTAAEETVLILLRRRQAEIAGIASTGLVPNVAAEFVEAAELNETDGNDDDDESIPVADEENDDVSKPSKTETTTTTVDCPAHGIGCRVSVDDLELITCKYGCVGHRGLALKADSKHPDAAKQRAFVVNRCADCDLKPPSDDQKRLRALPAPADQPTSLEGTAPCPNHIGCRVLAKFLILNDCRKGDNCKTGGHRAIIFTGPFVHPQANDYNKKQRERPAYCDRDVVRNPKTV